MGSKPSAERDPGAMGFYLSPIPSAVGPVMKGSVYVLARVPRRSESNARSA